MDHLPSSAFHRKRWALFALLLIAVALLAACGRNTKEREIQFALQRLAPQVFMGEDAASLQALTTDSPQPISPGFVISTDAAGEGLLYGKLPSNETCSVHIFFDTSLRVAACSKAEQMGGSTVTCQEEGTAVYQGCVANLQQTPSGVIQIVGSWVAVSYLPEDELTLVTVLEGQAQVYPVLEREDAYTLGEPISLMPGEFLFTQPDARLAPIQDLEPRQPLPVRLLPQVLKAKGLTDVYDRVQKKAQEDEVLPEEPPFVIQGAGGPLEEPEVGQAVIMSVNWEDLRSRVSFSDAAIPVILPGIDGSASDFPFDPAQTRAILQKREMEPLDLYVVMEDALFAHIADPLESYFAKANIRVRIIPDDPVNATGQIRELLAQGVGVLWIGPELDANLTDWVRKQAPPTPQAPAFVVQGVGGPLEDPFVGRAVLTAIDWQTLQDIFANGHPIPIHFPGVEGLAPDDFPYDPVYARQILGESGAEGGFLILLVTLEDEPHLKAVDAIQGYLAEIGVKTAVYPTEINIAPDLLAELASTGEAVVWLGPDIPGDWRETAKPSAETLTLTPHPKLSGALTSFEEALPGRWAVGDTDENATVQLLLTFDISDIPPEARITDAHLDLAKYKISGDPFRDLGCLRAYPHTARRFSVESFVWEKELGAVARWCSAAELATDDAQADVMETLQERLGQKTYQLRLRFNERDTDDDGRADLIQFTNPTLIISYTMP